MILGMVTPSAVPREDHMTDPRRSLAGRIGAHTLHSQHDSRDLTAHARAAFLARFEREVDPEVSLEPGERRRRAAQARKAYFARLAFLSAESRRSNAPSVKNAASPSPRGAAQLGRPPRHGGRLSSS